MVLLVKTRGNNVDELYIMLMSYTGYITRAKRLAAAGDNVDEPSLLYPLVFNCRTVNAEEL